MDTGDALLQAVAGRLNGILRDGDFAVRMGGDEFVVVQASVGNREEAMLLGRRIIRTLSEPFVVDGVEVMVGASVGTSVGTGTGAGAAEPGEGGRDPDDVPGSQVPHPQA